jgi:hypothetical protein
VVAQRSLMRGTETGDPFTGRRSQSTEPARAGGPRTVVGPEGRMQPGPDAAAAGRSAELLGGRVAEFDRTPPLGLRPPLETATQNMTGGSTGAAARLHGRRRHQAVSPGANVRRAGVLKLDYAGKVDLTQVGRPRRARPPAPTVRLPRPPPTSLAARCCGSRNRSRAAGR